MKFEGGCYCGAVRYEAVGEPLMKAQCHCRECQYITGGHPNVILGMPRNSFKYTRGEPAQYSRTDVDQPRTREFCQQCGTHLTTLSPNLPTGVFVKVGSMDDPSEYGAPEVVIQTADAQCFHHIPSGVDVHQRWAG